MARLHGKRSCKGNYVITERFSIKCRSTKTKVIFKGLTQGIFSYFVEVPLNCRKLDCERHGTYRCFKLIIFYCRRNSLVIMTTQPQPSIC